MVQFGPVVHAKRAFRLSLPAFPFTRSPWHPSPQVYPVLQTYQNLQNIFICIFLTWLLYSLALLSTINVHSGYHFPLFPSPEAHNLYHLKVTLCYRHLTFFVAFFSSVVWYNLALLSMLNVHSGYHFPLLPSPNAPNFHHLKFTQCYRHIKIFKIFLFVFFSLVVVLFGPVVHAKRAFRLLLPTLLLSRSPWFPPPKVYPLPQRFNSNYFLYFLALFWYSLALLSMLKAHSCYHLTLFPHTRSPWHPPPEVYPSATDI